MKLEDIRRDYLKNRQKGLHRKDLKDNPFDQFSDWLNEAIAAEITSDPTAMCLSTVNEQGAPSQRIVLLKHFDSSGFVFYTNLGSRKSKEIETNPRVCLHFGWLPMERQVIIYGQAEKLSLAQVTQYFLSRPKSSQLAAWTSHQSQPISSRKLLMQTFEQMKHRFSQGEIPLPSFWGGYRVVPTAIEFWQGGGDRLHDRFMYQVDDQNQWSIERLQP